MVHDEGPDDGGGSGRPAPTARMRASDAERAEVVAAVQRAGADGRLTLDEVDHRTAAAYSARFRDELDPLTVDLPASQPELPRAGWPGLWHGFLRQSRATLLGVAPEEGAVPGRRQEVLGALAVLVVLVWLALWILIGFGVGVTG